MNRDFSEHLIFHDSTIELAIKKLDLLASDNVLFVINSNRQLQGSLTDGDIRRGLINGNNLNTPLNKVMYKSPRSMHYKLVDSQKLKSFRQSNYKIIPLVDDTNCIVDILNFRFQNTILPLDVVVMAGGKGRRLLPLTKNLPKPLLKLGNKPIIERIIDGLITYGITKIDVSINHLGHLIKEALGNGTEKGIQINYIEENQPLGTIGSLGLKSNYSNPYTLVLNSDLLTNIDYEDFFIDFLKKKADFSAVGIPYKIEIPYGIFEMQDDRIKQINEKPTYTYFSNGGIYIFKTELIDLIPKNQIYLATDFIQDLISMNKKVTSYSLMDYWLDIGSHSDFERAQKDIKSRSF